MKDYPCRSHYPFWKNSENQTQMKKKPAPAKKSLKESKPLALIFLLFLAIFTFDFALKCWAFHSITEPIVVFRTPFKIDFILQCVTNRGGAWGMLASFHESLLIFRIGVVVALLGYLFCYRHTVKHTVFFTMIIAGAFGNVFDSIYYGFVIDMLHFVFWGNSYGIFNLADAMIFLGAIGLVLPAMKKQKGISHAK